MFERIKKYREQKEAAHDYEARYLAEYVVKDFAESYRKRWHQRMPWDSGVLIYNDERDIHSEEYSQFDRKPTGPVDRFSFYGPISSPSIQIPGDGYYSYELNSAFLRCFKKRLEELVLQYFPSSACATISAKRYVYEIAGEFGEFGRETLSCIKVEIHCK